MGNKYHSNFNVAVVYLPYDYDSNDLIEFLIDTSEQLLSENPKANIIISGDLKLNIRDLLDVKANIIKYFFILTCVKIALFMF